MEGIQHTLSLRRLGGDYGQSSGRGSEQKYLGVADVSHGLDSAEGLNAMDGFETIICAKNSFQLLIGEFITGHEE